MKSFLVSLSALLLAGCVLPPEALNLEEVRHPHKLSAREWATFSLVSTPLVFNDPAPVFGALFPRGSAIFKDPLETEAEFKARLATSGYLGREFTFFIAPDHCRIAAFPEENLYVVTSRDHYTDPPGYRPPAFRIAEIAAPSTTGIVSNRFGATAEATIFHSTILQVAPMDMRALPASLRWTADYGMHHFGVPIIPPDPMIRDELRERLKANKIGLAVRIRITDLTRLDWDLYHSSATVADPYGSMRVKLVLPAVLLDAWMVDADTHVSLVHWHNERA